MNNLNDIKIILGSSSPRRKKILSLFFDTFDVYSPNIDESVLENESPEIYTMRMAWEKCENVAQKTNLRNCIIITSDTTVACQNKIFGKPEDRNEAFNTLKFLSNRTHQVITSICVQMCLNDIIKTDCRIAKTAVSFKKLSDNGINDYLTKTNFLDKAGSYAIQENGEIIISAVQGSKSSVVGFPSNTFINILTDNELLPRLFN